MRDTERNQSRQLPSAAPADQRQHGRTAVSVPVRLRGCAPRWRHATCTDIGKGGLGVRTGEILAVGEVVEVEFLEAHSAITVRARVIYRQGQYYGLAFLDGSPRLL